MTTQTKKMKLAELNSSQRVVYAVDSHHNGLEIGMSKLEPHEDPREEFHLALPEYSRMTKLRSRHTVRGDKPHYELERKLRRISERGNLGSASFYFGVTTDPFHPFEGKFDASMKFLRLFEKYRPGMLTIQTRSPLVLLALSVLQQLGDRVAVTIGIETPLDSVARRYTPELPKISERLSAASALRRFGLEVNLQVAPLLPYGNWERDAGEFAELLVDHGESIFVSPFNDGSEASEHRVRSSLLGESLACDGKLEWIRPHSEEPLIRAISKIAPEKLVQPVREHMLDKQMSIFVA